jgi:HNH endonuclease
MKNDLTVEYVRSILDYDPATGNFIWRARNDVPPNWVGRWAGRKAGRINHHGYVDISIHRSRYPAHRLAWLYMTGEWPSDEIDHKDLNRFNNSWANLRTASVSENRANCKVRRHSGTQLKGVYRDKDYGRYYAQISIGGKTHHLGSYLCPAAASIAFALASEKHRGEFARHS